MSFFVSGEPRPQGSKTVGTAASGRSYVYERSGDKLKRWRRAVRWEAGRAMAGGPPMPGAVALRVDFYMPRGKSVKRQVPSVKPDLDKLLRAVGDSLTGVVYCDDCRIVSIDAHKRYEVDHGPGAQITVEGVSA